MHGTFDRPDAKLTVAPVVVAGGHAVAGWTQGDMGGPQLLYGSLAFFKTTGEIAHTSPTCFMHELLKQTA